jgi:hypothetical protein
MANVSSERGEVNMKTRSQLVVRVRRCILVIAVAFGISSIVMSAALKLPLDSLPPGHAKGVVYVQFVEGTEWLATPQELMPADVLQSVQTVKPLFTLPKAQLEEMRVRGQERLLELKALGVPLPFEEAPDLTLWSRIVLKEGVDQLDFINSLKSVNGVKAVELELLPSPPPFFGATPDFTGLQGYLDPAPGGIDGDYSWTVPGGTGLDVTIYDVEYSWNQNHEDLDTAFGVPLLLLPGDANNDPFGDNNHGTAVLGELIATDDAIGVTGISFDAGIGLAPAKTALLGYQPANAIALATLDADPGDVILIEQQTGVCGLTPSCDDTQINCGPLEWNGPVFSAIQAAVALGITVVEAAGNGSVDLDQTACGSAFNRNFQDSGAIIVGAAGAGSRERLGFSSYGSRVDVQGWGGSVMTTGYGSGCPSDYCDEADPANADRWYTPGFGGTSSASPIVTGAVANLQGVAMANGGGQPLLPGEVRDILVATGSPQLGDTSEHIGPRPDLRRAIAEIIPVLQVPTSLDFGDVCVGGSSMRTLEVCNVSKQDLNIASVSSSDPQFTVTEPTAGFPVIISPDHCFPFEVSLTPSSGGAASATVTVDSNDPVNPSVDVPASGTGTGPTIATVIANSGDFGDVCKDTFKDLDLTINNSGDCELIVDNITSSDPNFDVPGVMDYPLVIGPQDSLRVPLRFSPDDFGAYSATFTIFTNDPGYAPGTGKEILVIGNTPHGDVRITGSSDFGNVCAGVLAEKQISVCNVGPCNLSVLPGTGFDPECEDFVLINQWFPAMVSPDFCMDLVIRFTPQSVGFKQCTLKILTDDEDDPITLVTITGTAPQPMIDVPPDVGFPPEVIQSVDSCVTQEPFPISNTGICPLEINSVVTQTVKTVPSDPDEYFTSGLPSFPIILDPGNIAGSGDLRVDFRPQDIDRDILGSVEVTYVSDPFKPVPETTVVTRDLCGEGVFTGARVLVTEGGVPVSEVKSLKLQRLTANRNKDRLDSIDTARNLPLVTVDTLPAPCGMFQYHREYGTESNPVQLSTGSYQVTATIRNASGRIVRRSVGFNVDSCDFNPTIIIDF